MCDVCAQTSRIRKSGELLLLGEVRRLVAIAKEDPYEKIAAELQELLLRKWDESSRRAIEELLARLENAGGDGAFDAQDLEQMVKELKAELGASFPDRTIPLLEQKLEEAYETAAVAPGITAGIQFNVIDERAESWLKEHHAYWVRSHFDRHTQERVVELGTRAIAEGLGRYEAGKLFAAELGVKLGQSQSYWENFANHAVTRSREFGRVDGYVTAGVKRLKIVTIADRRRSAICTFLDGKVFDVGSLVSFRDQLMQASDPEAVKTVAPWYRPEDLAKLDPKSLPANLSMPPYHFGCRSRTVAADTAE